MDEGAGQMTYQPTDAAAEAAIEESNPEIVRRRQDIAATRDELAGSIDELSYRLSPGTIKSQAIEGARDMATGAKTSLMETVKSNPIPSAIVAGGLYMLFKNRSSSGRQGISSRNLGYGPNTYVTGGYDSRGSASGQIRGAVDSAMGQGKSAVDTIGETAGQVGGRVHDAAGQVTDRAQQVTEQAQTTAQDTITRVQYAARQNPLGAAFVVAGLGAAIGLLLPRTEKENELLGQARDQVVEQASQKMQEVGEKVQKVAQASADTAQQEAAKQNLPTPQTTGQPYQ